MRLIVTRPRAQAASWVSELRALGCDAQALPLIEIEALPDAAPVRAAWGSVMRGDYALLMFVSANAVEQFFACAPQPMTPMNWPTATRAGSTGPGTSAALRAAGVPGQAIAEPKPEAEKFDSEALWAQLEHENWRGQSALVVRGEEGRDWLADTLRARGATVDFVAAYRRLAPSLDVAGQALLVQALADPQTHLWLFSSSEAVGHLRDLAPGADWSRGCALASHPRIAAAAKALGFAQILSSAPSPAAVAQASQAASQAATQAASQAASQDPSIQSSAL